MRKVTPLFLSQHGDGQDFLLDEDDKKGGGKVNCLGFCDRRMHWVVYRGAIWRCEIFDEKSLVPTFLTAILRCETSRSFCEIYDGNTRLGRALFYHNQKIMKLSDHWIYYQLGLLNFAYDWGCRSTFMRKWVNLVDINRENSSDRLIADFAEMNPSASDRQKKFLGKENRCDGLVR